MDVYECIKTRRSIRKYKDVPIPWDNVGKILEAGESAPSCGNIQNWKFIVVQDEGARRDIALFCANQTWMIEAPVHIVIVADVNKGRMFYGLRGERLYTIQNCAAAAENMLLMAHSLGLGACWIGSFEEEKLIPMLTLAEGIRPQIIITIGYAAEDPPSPPKYTHENSMYFRQWGGQGNRIQDIPQYKGEFSYKIKDAINATKKAVQKLNKTISGDDEKK